MEILSSGSFINLDNTEKIEQLVYTAREIATTAIKTEGFEANEENNKKLALDIWEGAEYMCRDSEEVQIKNMFLNNFLERMREISGISEIPDNSLATAETSPVKSKENNDSNDEYLGLVQTPQEQENSESNNDSNESIEEPVKTEEETPQVISATDVAHQEADQNVESFSDEQTKSEDIEVSNKIEAEQPDSAQENIELAIQSAQSEITHQANTKTDSLGSIVLQDKESYQFDRCTVTATIQLLPTDLGIRKVILSVRTHDFPPQISILEMESEANTEQMVSALDESFEKYKSDLPVKVMDKLRKEKSSGKSTKRSKKVKSSTTTLTNSANDSSISQKTVKTGETSETTAQIPQTETNLQGSLFGSKCSSDSTK